MNKRRRKKEQKKKQKFITEMANKVLNRHADAWKELADSDNQPVIYEFMGFVEIPK